MSWPFVRQVIRHAVVASTNDVARELAASGKVELPLAVWADRQTNGRGRGENVWWSDEGSLTFSLLLDPAGHELRPEHEPRLALATAVAVVNAIAENLPAARIRWPNDVEVGCLKLGGILPERVETPEGVRLVVGIGMNVRTNLADAPAEVRRMAVAYGECDVEELLRNVFGEISGVLKQLAKDDPALSRRWDQLDALRDQWVRVRLGPRIVEGIGRGIDAEGALLLAGEREVFRLFGGQVLRG